MRKIKYIIAGISAAVFMVSCELDNFDGPDAQVYGAVIDAETEELIQQEIGTSGDAACVQVIEYGYAIRKVQQWKLMLNGEYQKNFGPEAQQTPYIALMNAQLDRYAGCAIGAVAPEITGRDTLGNPIKLSDFRGKYVIVDFWEKQILIIK